MTSFQQVRDIINHSVDFHKQAHTLYSRLMVNSTNERSKLLLNYLISHSKKLIETYQRYQTESHHALDTWIQYTSQHNHNDFFQKLDPESDLSVSEVEELGFCLDNYMLSLYKELKEHAEFGPAEDFFVDILDGEEKQKRQLSYAVGALWDF